MLHKITSRIWSFEFAQGPQGTNCFVQTCKWLNLYKSFVLIAHWGFATILLIGSTEDQLKLSKGQGGRSWQAFANFANLQQKTLCFARRTRPHSLQSLQRSAVASIMGCACWSEQVNEMIRTTHYGRKDKADCMILGIKQVVVCKFRWSFIFLVLENAWLGRRQQQRRGAAVAGWAGQQQEPRHQARWPG